MSIMKGSGLGGEENIITVPRWIQKLNANREVKSSFSINENDSQGQATFYEIWCNLLRCKFF